MKAVLEVSRAADGWRWRLRVSNRRTLADSGEGAVTRRGARSAARRLRVWAERAEVAVA